MTDEQHIDWGRPADVRAQVLALEARVKKLEEAVLQLAARK